ncbi:hypothetical protein O3P69_014879 [Scylla paramamosain]|uniref:Uncharacterized protein n=1 Tax=Scylla paramamosain TaxID=85552 RepID=A0AAW0TYB0_SCYPA
MNGAEVNVAARPYMPYWGETRKVDASGVPVTRYLGPDFQMLKAVSTALNFSFRIMATESWTEVPDNYARVKGYSAWVRKDRSTQGGGVAFCYKETVSGQVVEPPTPVPGELELLALKITDSNGKDHVAVLTRIQFRTPREESFTRTLWRWEAADWDALRAALKTTDWGDVMYGDANQQVEDKVTERECFLVPIVYMMIIVRLQRFDFTYNYLFDGTAFVMAKPTMEIKWQGLYRPLSWLPWACVAASLLSVAVVLWLGRIQCKLLTLAQEEIEGTHP